MDLPDKDFLLALYRQMLVIRRFEETAARTYREGHIPGFIHLYIGEEAVATGVCPQASPAQPGRPPAGKGIGHRLAHD